MTDRTMPPERLPRQPILNAPPVTTALVVVLAVVFAAIKLAPAAWSDAASLHLSLVPAWIGAALADPARGASLAVFATLLTHALVHTQTLHFAANAGMLLAFGSACERALGPRRTVVLMVGSALGGAAAQLLADWGEIAVMQGASGVVMGCMGGMVRLLLGGGAAQRRAALTFVAALAVINVLLGVAGGALVGVEGDIAWEAHAGGFVAGFLLARRPRPAA